MRKVCVSVFRGYKYICWYLVFPSTFKSSISSILKRNMNSIMLVLHISRLRFWLRGERGAQPCPRKRYIKSVHQWDREATVLICRYQVVFVLYISIVSSYIPFLMVATSRGIYILRENDIYQQLEWHPQLLSQPSLPSSHLELTCYYCPFRVICPRENV